MTQQSMRAFVAKPFNAFTRESQHRLALLMCIAILLLMALPAWGGTVSPGRMVYANGQIHKISMSNYGYMYHQAGLPADQVNGSGPFVAVKDGGGVTVPADRGPYICRYRTLASNEGLAVFNNKIFVVYTKDTSCGNSGNMSAYVASFNMTGDPQHPNGWWDLTDYKLGPVGYYAASAAAITVFNGQLYIFTDHDTYTSANGVSFSAHSKPLLPAGRQPLDAVTIYSQSSPPQILLVYSGPACTGCNYFTYVYGATWNGDFNSSRRDYAGNCSGASSRCLPGNPLVGYGTSHSEYEGRVSLLPGTRNASTVTGSLPGDKVLAVQLFMQMFNMNNATDKWTRNLEFHVEDGNWYKGDVDYHCSGWMVYPWYVPACEVNQSQFQARKQRIVYDGCGSPSFDSDFLVPQNARTSQSCDSPAGVMTTASADNALTRNYLSLIGVVLGTPPFSMNRVTDVAQVRDISNVLYATSTEGTTTHSQTWTHQNMISTGGELHAGLFDDLVKITESFDITYKHDWESTHEDKSSQSVVSETPMGTGTYAEGVFEPVPYGGSCTTNADCAQYVDPFAGDIDPAAENYPACRIYVQGAELPWRNCQDGDTGCMCTVTSTGKTGWALFNAPNVFVQDHKVYAYDYNHLTGSGTSLNQNLHTVEAKGFSVVPVSFDLKHPELTSRVKNPDGTITGLLEGMQSFPYSTEIPSWSNQPWNRTDLQWRTKVGPGTNPNIPTVTHDRGANQGQSYTQSTLQMDSSGKTASTEIHNSTGVEAGTGLLGFGWNLTVGKDSSFSTSVTADTTFSKNVKADLKMADCTPGMPGCITKLTTQPYLLVATGKAPWVPNLYPVAEGKDGPWCMTWAVTNWCPGGPLCGTSPVPTLAVASATSTFDISALGLPPQQASGRIVGGTGGDDQGADRYSHYSLEGGRLAWVDSSGTEKRIPMTADDFDPSKGVTFEVNGKPWSSTNGSWTRSGEIWIFQPDPKAQEERVILTLDFGSATYDLQIQKVNLEGYTFAGMTDLVLRLDLNGKYMFSTTIHHDVDMSWQWSKKPADDVTMHVTSFQGRYNSGIQSGKMSIAGSLPKVLNGFGDVGIEINGEQRNFPLLSMDDFQHAVDTGGVLKYAKEGLILVVDFGNKTWSATFNNRAFSRLLVPRWGNIKAKILVGGLPLVDREDAVLDFSANLTLRR